MRVALPFRAVNRRSSPDYQPGMQRHHLLPRQILHEECFSTMFEKLGRSAVGFDDFRANGLLLPSISSAALQTGLPLHRGPHRQYNEMVRERVGCIEDGWSRRCPRDAPSARTEALMRLDLLQRALRKQLMRREKRSLFLNRKDPFRAGVDFTHLDAMVEVLWAATG